MLVGGLHISVLLVNLDIELHNLVLKIVCIQVYRSILSRGYVIELTVELYHFVDHVSLFLSFSLIVLSSFHR